jgi:hypothetical protein
MTSGSVAASTAPISRDMRLMSSSAEKKMERPSLVRTSPMALKVVCSDS